MYCPRCGSPNTDTTKYCRQCGLPMTPVSGYVSTGGTAALAQVPPTGSSPIDKVTEGLTLKQRLVVTILLWLISPALLAVLDETLGGYGIIDRIIPFAAILMPVGIVWAVFRYKAKKSLLEAQAEHSQIAPPQAMPVSYQQPALEQAPYRPPIEPPRTNPLTVEKSMPGSVTEEDTRHLPGQEESRK